MSRIGKKPIQIPQGVEVKIENSVATVKGPKGTLTLNVNPAILAEVKEGNIICAPKAETKESKALWGLTRALLQNTVVGVTQGYEKKLETVGIGYGATMEGANLVLKVGYSHVVKVPAEEGVKFSVEKSVITISGIDKEKVGNVAAKIRAIKKPEPYQGKGIRYQGEVVRKKLGKKAAKA